MIRTAAVVLVAAAAAIVLNVVLLQQASGGSDPVGRLRPLTHVPAAPAWTVRPAHQGEHQNDGADD